MIRYYTREAGVRNLERELANLARKAVKEIVTKKAKKIAITTRNLEKYAGVRKHRYGDIEDEDMVGVVTGLAWTEVGGRDPHHRGRWCCRARATSSTPASLAT